MIKGLKKVGRSMKQGQQLIESSLEILNLPNEYAVLLVIALNITITLNASNDTENASKDLSALQLFSREFLAKFLDTSDTFKYRELIELFKYGMLRYGSFDNLLRVQSSLEQRSREQVTYTSKLNGLGLLDGMVRDKRLEMLVVLALERAVTLSLSNQVYVEALLEGCRYAASSESSGELYRQGMALLDFMQGQNNDEEDENGRRGTEHWSHRHFHDAQALVSGGVCPNHVPS